MRLHVPVPVRWGDLDAYGHVNNVAVLGFLEEARIAAFWRHPDAAEQAWPTAILDAGPGSATVTVVARQEIEYLQPIDHRRDPLTVEVWLGRLGGASIEVCYEITAVVGGVRTVFVQAETTIVLLDAESGRPRRVTEAEREVWRRYSGPPVPWRRRDRPARRGSAVAAPPRHRRVVDRTAGRAAVPAARPRPSCRAASRRTRSRG